MSDDDKYVLNFKISGGIADGWTARLTSQCLDWHKKKHGGDRPELFDGDFIQKDVKEALEDPIVYPGFKGNLWKKIVDRGVYIFYKESATQKYQYNGKLLPEFTKVVVRKKRKKILEIITPLKTSRINNKKLCEPIKKI